MGADAAARRAVIAEIHVVGVGQHLLHDLQIDLAVVLVDELHPALAAGTGLLARVVEAVVLALQVADARVEHGVAAEVGAVEGALQAREGQALLEAGDLAGVVVGYEPGVGVTAVVLLVQPLNELVDGGRELHGVADAHPLGHAGVVVAVEAGQGSLGDVQAGGSHIEVGHGGQHARGRGLHDEGVALVGLHALAHVEVLAAPELVEALVAQIGLAVHSGRTGGHDGGAVLLAVGLHKRAAHDLPGVLGPPVAGDLHPVVPGDHVVGGGGHAGGRQALGHAAQLFQPASGNHVPVQLQCLFGKPLVGHAERFQGHELIDAQGVFVLVNEQVALLEAALVGSALHLQVLPAVHLLQLGAVDNLLLLGGNHCLLLSCASRGRDAITLSDGEVAGAGASGHGQSAYATASPARPCGRRWTSSWEMLPPMMRSAVID